MTKITPNQQLANEAYAHLKKTGKQSLQDHPNGGRKVCIYSSTGCAFSPAVLPEKRKECDELFICAGDLIYTHPECLQPWAQRVSPAFANDVQDAHDNINALSQTFFQDFSDSLLLLCEEYELEYPGDNDADV